MVSQKFICPKPTPNEVLMKQVIDLYKHILKTFKDGVKENRTAVPTIDIFGYQMRFNLSDGFPMPTTKFASFENIRKRGI